MAETQAQRVLHLARAGFGPPDIAEFLQISEQTVLADLANLTIDGASLNARILTFLLGGHAAPDIAQWLGVPVTTVQAAAQDLSQPVSSTVALVGGTLIAVPPYRL